MRHPQTVLLAILLAFAALLLFFHLDEPNVYVFDESHYVPAAKLYLDGKSETNYEHPPLGKEIIAAGIFLFGDNPWGWRSFSAVFGVLTLLAVYSLASTLLLSSTAALLSVALVVLNQFWFVESRVGTLDVFLVFFLFAGFQSLAKILFNSEARTSEVLVTGLSFGFAAACKWFGAVPFALIMCCIGIVSYKRHKFWQHCSLLIVTFNLVYFLTCIPFLLIAEPGHTLKGLFQLHVAAIDWQSHGERIQHHFSHSEWYAWPFATKGMIMYYLVDRVSVQFSEIILLLFNPVQTLLGWIGLTYAAFRAWKFKDTRAVLLLFIFASLYVPWSFIPHFNTYYYYYYPASVILALGVGYLFVHLQGVRKKLWGGLSLALSSLSFTIFYPLMAAVDLHDLPFWRVLLDRVLFLP